MRRLLLCLVLGGCVYMRSPVVPMPAQWFPAPSGAADRLVVMLPGLGDGPQRYVDNDFVTLAQAADPHCDVVCADAHFGYYRTRSVVERLHDDVIAPVADRYREVWLVGISMGGLGAALYGAAYPDAVTGLVLLAPFTGDADIVAEIEAAGGLVAWTPAASSEGDPVYRELWSWYRGYVTDPARRPSLFLGFGDEDKLRRGIILVAAQLPAERVETMPGAHTWSVWRPLFAALVGRALARPTAPRAFSGR